MLRVYTRRTTGKGLSCWGNAVLLEVLLQVSRSAARSILEKSGPSHDCRAMLPIIGLGWLLLFAVVPKFIPKVVHIHNLL